MATPALAIGSGEKVRAARIVPAFRSRAALLVIPALYLGHAAVFGDYIADDAGISLAYGRNLASGYGPVLYPGAEAVEGFSNPLWTLLLAAGAALRLDVADGIPLLKFLDLLFGAGGLLLTAVLARDVYPDDNPGIGWVAPVILAVWTPYVFWSGAGLENALYAFLLLLAVILQLRELRGVSAGWWSAVALGGVALTRPEGCAFFAPFLLHRVIVGRERWRLAAWTLTFAVLCAAYLAIRLVVFGDWLPNTYYAKIADRELGQLWSYVLTAEDPGRRYLGAFLLSNVLLLAVAAGGLLHGKYWRPHLLFAGIIGGTFLYALYAGGDFWPAQRFLTPALPFVAIAAQHGVSCVRLGLRRAQWIAAALVLVVVWQSVPVSLGLRDRHQQDTLISLQGRLESGHRMRALATALGIEDPLYADPDIGGPTLAGLRVLDLGGLTDIHIARFHYYPPFFRDYIFKERRPHFIRTHASWTRTSRITEYPEFHEQYVALTSKRDAKGLHGEFVRRDLLEGRPTGEAASGTPSFAQAVADAGARRLREDGREREGWIPFYVDRHLFDRLASSFRAHEAAGTLPAKPALLEDLYFGLLAAGERAAAERVRAAASIAPIAPVVLRSDGEPMLALLAHRVVRRDLEYPRLQLLFDVLRTPRTNYDLWLHLQPTLPPRAPKITSSHTPRPGTSSWAQGTIAFVEKPLYQEPGDYDIRAGLWEPASKASLCHGSSGDTCYLLLGTHRLGR